MRKLVFLTAITAVLLLRGETAFAQARLKVTQIFNFPVTPFDTAFEGPHYDSIHIVVQNIGTTNFYEDINILLYSTSMGYAYRDTLRWSLNAHPLMPGQSTSLNNVPMFYFFRSTHYAAGDNIIVVWPFSRIDTTLLPPDSLYINIFFEPLVGISEPSPAAFS